MSRTLTELWHGNIIEFWAYLDLSKESLFVSESDDLKSCNLTLERASTVQNDAKLTEQLNADVGEGVFEEQSRERSAAALSLNGATHSGIGTHNTQSKHSSSQQKS